MLVKIEIAPGFKSQSTQVQATGAWFAGNLIRWRQGLPEKLPGWVRLLEDQFLWYIRRMHAWLDLSNNWNLFVGTDAGLEIVVNDTRTVLVPGVVVPDARLSTWHLDNLGENGMAVVTYGALIRYLPGVLVGTVIEAPAVNTGMFVAMPQAQVILWGTEPIPFSGIIDPLLIRFSDVGTYDVWTATVSNQAGSYRLSRGSRIMGAIQAPQTTLIFTDMDVWSMSYIGPPLVYGFTIVGTGCGLVAPHAVVTLGKTTYWQGTEGFWQYGDGGVRPLPSTVHDYIFNDIDADDIAKCHAGANSIGNEVMWFFPSTSEPFIAGTIEGSGYISTNEPTRYVKYTVTEQVWDSGELARTAWINVNIFGKPLAGDLNFRVQQHETGFDDDDQPMRGVYLESGFVGVGDNSQIAMVDQCQPDFKWFGKNGGVNLTLQARGYAGSQSITYGPWSMTETTQYFNPRVRGRYLSARYDWAARKGFSARLGATTLRFKPAGRRP